MTAEYVRGYYRVPAKVGGRITFQNHPAVITGFRGQYLLIRRDHDPESLLAIHPTWEVEYIDPAKESR